MAHATLGASGAYRWRACPGSVRLSEGIPSRSSIFAQVGTVAHELAEICLARRTVPEKYMGAPVNPDFPEIVVDQDMADAVNVYLRHVRPLITRAVKTGGRVWVEAKVSLEDLGGVGEEMFGTADLIVYTDEILYVFDYKHGSGVPVEVEENDQLLYYALGALLKLWADAGTDAPVKRIYYHVVQPRCEHPGGPVRAGRIDPVDLLDWASDLFRDAERTKDPDAPIVPGKHCRFCPAQPVCPAQREKRMKDAKLVFGESGVEPVKPLSRLTLSELRQIVDNADDIIAWVKSAKELAQTRLENGLDMPGYKLVQKRAVRKWALGDDDMADALCEKFGLGDEDLFERKLRSPAQIEKALKADKNTKQDLAEFVTAESSGTTLAPEGDKRPAVKVSPRPAPEDVFDELD